MSAGASLGAGSMLGRVLLLLCARPSPP